MEATQMNWHRKRDRSGGDGTGEIFEGKVKRKRLTGTEAIKFSDGGECWRRRNGWLGIKWKAAFEIIEENCNKNINEGPVCFREVERRSERGRVLERKREEEDEEVMSVWREG